MLLFVRFGLPFFISGCFSREKHRRLDDTSLHDEAFDDWQIEQWFITDYNNDEMVSCQAFQLFSNFVGVTFAQNQVSTRNLDSALRNTQFLDRLQNIFRNIEQIEKLENLHKNIVFHQSNGSQGVVP